MKIFDEIQDKITDQRVGTVAEQKAQRTGMYAHQISDQVAMFGRKNVLTDKAFSEYNSPRFTATYSSFEHDAFYWPMDC